MVKKMKKGKIVWIDIETTGIDARKNKIIELAIKITDNNLNLIDEKGLNLTILYTKDEIDENINEWCLKTHQESGLYYKCLDKEQSKKINIVENEIIDYIDKYVESDYKPILAGNSTGSLDRPFIKQWMNKLNNRLSIEKNLDITSIRIFMDNIYNTNNISEKKRKHLALDDVNEAINELKELIDIFKNNEKKEETIYENLLWFDLNKEKLKVKITNGKMNQIKYDKIFILNEKSLKEIEKEILHDIDELKIKDRMPLCGTNTSFKDREFVMNNMELLDKKIHYRNMDLTSLRYFFDNIIKDKKMRLSSNNIEKNIKILSIGENSKRVNKIKK